MSGKSVRQEAAKSSLCRRSKHEEEFISGRTFQDADQLATAGLRKQGRTTGLERESAHHLSGFCAFRRFHQEY